MAVKKYPYGYMMVRGKIKIYETEAEKVRRLFSKYIAGKSMWAIGVELLNENDPYFSGTKKKAYCKVSMIIHDNRYTGTDEFPAIIDKKIFEQARERWKDNVFLNMISKKKVPEFVIKNDTIYTPCVSVIKHENELKKKINGSFDSEEIRDLILQLAAEKYKCIK